MVGDRLDVVAGRSLDGEKSTWLTTAWPVGESLSATTMEGEIQRLKPAVEAGEILEKTRDPRFFHRLLPVGHRQLLAIGGTRMDQGKFSKLEAILVPE